jgi:hypothetical protein
MRILNCSFNNRNIVNTDYNKPQWTIDPELTDIIAYKVRGIQGTTLLKTIESNNRLLRIYDRLTSTWYNVELAASTHYDSVDDMATALGVAIGATLPYATSVTTSGLNAFIRSITITVISGLGVLDFYFQTTPNSFGRSFGFTTDVLSVPNGTSVTGFTVHKGQYKLPYKNMFLCSDRLSEANGLNNYINGKRSTMIQPFQFDYEENSVIRYTWDNDWNHIHDCKLYYLDFYFTDLDGNVVPLAGDNSGFQIDIDFLVK